MKQTIQELIKKIEGVIDTLELHTETKSAPESKYAVKEAFKSLYQIKDYFESFIDKNDTNGHIETDLS
jgi:molecular chaperone GrpE (heat shock protein)